MVKRKSVRSNFSTNKKPRKSENQSAVQGHGGNAGNIHNLVLIKSEIVESEIVAKSGENLNMNESVEDQLGEVKIKKEFSETGIVKKRRKKSKWASGIVPNYKKSKKNISRNSLLSSTSRALKNVKTIYHSQELPGTETTSSTGVPTELLRSDIPDDNLELSITTHPNTYSPSQATELLSSPTPDTNAQLETSEELTMTSQTTKDLAMTTQTTNELTMTTQTTKELTMTSQTTKELAVASPTTDLNVSSQTLEQPTSMEPTLPLGKNKPKRKRGRPRRFIEDLSSSLIKRKRAKKIKRKRGRPKLESASLENLKFAGTSGHQFSKNVSMGSELKKPVKINRTIEKIVVIKNYPVYELKSPAQMYSVNTLNFPVHSGKAQNNLDLLCEENINDIIDQIEPVNNTDENSLEIDEETENIVNSLANEIPDDDDRPVSGFKHNTWLKLKECSIVLTRLREEEVEKWSKRQRICVPSPYLSDENFLSSALVISSSDESTSSSCKGAVDPLYKPHTKISPKAELEYYSKKRVKKKTSPAKRGKNKRLIIKQEIKDESVLEALLQLPVVPGEDGLVSLKSPLSPKAELPNQFDITSKPIKPQAIVTMNKVKKRKTLVPILPKGIPLEQIPRFLSPCKIETWQKMTQPTVKKEPTNNDSTEVETISKPMEKQPKQNPMSLKAIAETPYNVNPGLKKLVHEPILVSQGAKQCRPQASVKPQVPVRPQVSVKPQTLVRPLQSSFMSNPKYSSANSNKDYSAVVNVDGKILIIPLEALMQQQGDLDIPTTIPTSQTKNVVESTSDTASKPLLGKPATIAAVPPNTVSNSSEQKKQLTSNDHSKSLQDVTKTASETKQNTPTPYSVAAASSGLTSTLSALLNTVSSTVTKTCVTTASLTHPAVPINSTSTNTLTSVISAASLLKSMVANYSTTANASTKTTSTISTTANASTKTTSTISTTANASTKTTSTISTTANASTKTTSTISTTANASTKTTSTISTPANASTKTTTTISTTTLTTPTIVTNSGSTTSTKTVVAPTEIRTSNNISAISKNFRTTPALLIQPNQAPNLGLVKPTTATLDLEGLRSFVKNSPLSATATPDGKINVSVPLNLINFTIRGQEGLGILVPKTTNQNPLLSLPPPIMSLKSTLSTPTMTTISKSMMVTSAPTASTGANTVSTNSLIHSASSITSKSGNISANMVYAVNHTAGQLQPKVVSTGGLIVQQPTFASSTVGRVSSVVVNKPSGLVGDSRDFFFSQFRTKPRILAKKSSVGPHTHASTPHHNASSKLQDILNAPSKAKPTVVDLSKETKSNVSHAPRSLQAGSTQSGQTNISNKDAPGSTQSGQTNISNKDAPGKQHASCDNSHTALTKIRDGLTLSRASSEREKTKTPSQQCLTSNSNNSDALPISNTKEMMTMDKGNDLKPSEKMMRQNDKNISDGKTIVNQRHGKIVPPTNPNNNYSPLAIQIPNTAPSMNTSRLVNIAPANTCTNLVKPHIGLQNSPPGTQRLVTMPEPTKHLHMIPGFRGQASQASLPMHEPLQHFQVMSNQASASENQQASATTSYFIATNPSTGKPIALALNGEKSTGPSQIVFRATTEDGKRILQPFLVSTNVKGLTEQQKLIIPQSQPQETFRMIGQPQVVQQPQQIVQPQQPVPIILTNSIHQPLQIYSPSIPTSPTFTQQLNEARVVTSSVPKVDKNPSPSSDLPIKITSVFSTRKNIKYTRKNPKLPSNSWLNSASGTSYPNPSEHTFTFTDNTLDNSEAAKNAELNDAIEKLSRRGIELSLAASQEDKWGKHPPIEYFQQIKLPPGLSISPTLKIKEEPLD